MSAKICWEPVKSNPKTLDVGSPSEFRRIMEEVFGGFPVNLAEKDAPTLRAMESATKRGVYGNLADLVEKHGEIRLWAEY